MSVHGHQQISLGAGADHRLDFGHVQCRTQELQQEIPRKCRHRPDAQDLSPTVGTVLHHVHEFFTGARDLLRIAQGEPARLGQLQTRPFAFKKRMTKAFFKLL